MIRDDRRASRSCGSRAQSAVMPSRLVTARIEIAPSHVRSSLIDTQVLVPLADGELALGRWQGIFFCEFDGPRERKVYVTALA